MTRISSYRTSMLSCGGGAKGRIMKDRIGDACVRLAFNQDETWTRALKYILTNAKWILAYASNLSGGGNRP
jgi:Apg6 BARA domain